MKKLTAAGQPWAQVRQTPEEELRQAIDEVAMEAQRYGITLDDVKKAFDKMVELGADDVKLMKECAIEGLLQATGGAEYNDQGGKGSNTPEK